MIAGDNRIGNIIPESCEFGGTMRAVKREVLEKMGEEIEKQVKAVCEVYDITYEAEIMIHGDNVHNAPELLEGVQTAATQILGENQVYIIEEDNLGGENFSGVSAIGRSGKYLWGNCR